MPAQQVGPLEGHAAVLAEQLGPAHGVVHGALAAARAARQRRQAELHVVT